MNSALLSSKWLDYLDFKSVVNYFYTTGSSRLSTDKLACSSAIINDMNSGRTVIQFAVGNQRTSVSVLSINNIDALYDYLMFFLLDMIPDSKKEKILIIGV